MTEGGLLVVRLRRGGRDLWLRVLDSLDSPLETEIKVLSWTYGETNLVVSIPHSGTIGSDTTGEGDIYCASGHVIRTRIGTAEHPIRTYTRDAGSDIIGQQMAARLAEDHLRPHLIQCYVHRSKVECNRSLDEIAVERRREEAEQIYSTYHAWIHQAIEMCRGEFVPGVLLIDLHGHGHPHDHIELGYRITADNLNAIADPENERATWQSLMTSAARHEFTLRHLVRRKFGLDVESAVVGSASLAAALAVALSKCG